MRNAMYRLGKCILTLSLWGTQVVSAQIFVGQTQFGNGTASSIDAMVPTDDGAILSIRSEGTQDHAVHRLVEYRPAAREAIDLPAPSVEVVHMGAAMVIGKEVLYVDALREPAAEAVVLRYVREAAGWAFADVIEVPVDLQSSTVSSLAWATDHLAVGTVYGAFVYEPASETWSLLHDLPDAEEHVVGAGNGFAVYDVGREKTEVRLFEATGDGWQETSTMTTHYLDAVGKREAETGGQQGRLFGGREVAIRSAEGRPIEMLVLVDALDEVRRFVLESGQWAETERYSDADYSGLIQALGSNGHVLAASTPSTVEIQITKEQAQPLRIVIPRFSEQVSNARVHAHVQGTSALVAFGQAFYEVDLSERVRFAPVGPDPGTAGHVAEHGELVWEPVSGAESYTVEMLNVAGGVEPVRTLLHSDQARVSYDALTHGARHEWTVGAHFGDGRYARSPAFTFVTARGGPTQVQLDQPADGATVGPSLALSWQAVEGVESSYFRYDVELSTEPDFSTLVRNERVTDESTSLVVDGLDPGTYYWRVRAGNAAEQNWSDTRRFTIPIPTRRDPARPAALFNVSVYPNPATAHVELAIELDEPVAINVQVYSADGRRVESVSTPLAPAGRYVRRIDTADWPVGVYFVRVIAEDEVRMSRFVVLR